MAQEMSGVLVSDEAFQYLAIQRGKISDLSSDRVKWTQAYHQSLAADFETILPWLPNVADRILDVGSGMGGIDILLARHFHQPEVWLLDGDDDSPVMVRHAQTFNCMQTARKFLILNGVCAVVTSSPALERQPLPCDLIVSFQSWCFHYKPETYLSFVRQCCLPGTILILDLRRDNKAWRAVLRRALTEVAVASEGEKFERVVFKA